MNPHKLIHLKTRTASPLGRGLLLIPVLLICFALSSGVQAVVPPPDGGYPGSNTAEGTQALQSLTTGVWNTALGFQALFSDTTGGNNTATGLRSLFRNVNGVNNTATGVLALSQNTSASNNTAFGWSALSSNTTGANNTAVGVNALFRNNQNFQTAVGRDALFANTTGQENVAVGYKALAANTTNGFSVAVGFQALDQAFGGQNTAVGDNALGNVTTGARNTAIGDVAGQGLGTGSNNVYIGAFVGAPAVNESNTTRIKNVGTTPLNTGMFVEVDPSGKLGFVTSSRRHKHDIEPMADASEVLYALKPVTFRYNGDIDPAHVKMFGLIAEDVAKANPDLAVRDAKGEVIAIRSDSINAMLLNEFLKEHRRVEELQATVAQQQKGMELLAAQLKEQAAQIQKVSAQIETSKPAPQVVASTP
jgi:trimeric autotransporter adhesin